MPTATDAARHFVIIPAAGVGSRLGAGRPKQYLELGGCTVLERSVAPFLAADCFAAVVVVVAPGDTLAAGLGGLGDPRVQVLDAGGATRRLTVLAGLQWLAAHRGAADDDWVHVHDAARPGLDAPALARLRDALVDEPVGALLAVEVADTVKRGQGARVAQTVDREGLWLAQTPQAFRHRMLRDALEAHRSATDEASAIEAGGHRPALVAGSRRNFKITTAEDLDMMRVLFATGPVSGMAA
jgi:2-C-methyl-D-erythritol 4-phosphate cytidylyltransferase